LKGWQGMVELGFKLFLMLFIVLLFFPYAVLAVIEKGTTKIYAVTTEGKGLVANLIVEIEPGSGKVWSSVTPLVGTSTQNAERTAVNLAKKYSKNVNKYDYKFTIESPASVVDGPSAGAAMSLLVISMLTDRQLPNNISITGTINSEGKIGPVGGIFEKAKEASSTGIKLFLIPKGEALQIKKDASGKISSVNLLEYAPKYLGMKVIEVKNIDEAVKYAFSDINQIDINTDASTSIPDFIPEKLSLPPEMSGFKILVSNYINRTKEVISNSRLVLSASLLEDPDILHILQENLNIAESTIEKAEILNGQNYLYSAANYSYLAMVNAITVKEIALNPSLLTSDSPSFDLKLAELKAELESYRKNLSGNIPKKNFEWFISSQQRFAYAENTIKKLMTEQIVVLGGSEQDKIVQAFSRVKNYAFAYAWFEISRDFYNLAQDDFEFASPQPVFKKEAEENINLAKESIKKLNPDTSAFDDFKRRLDAAVLEFDSNWFEASYFDAVAAKAIADSELYFDSNQSIKDMNYFLSSKIEFMNSKIYDSSNKIGWAKLYLDHAKYFLEAANYYINANSEYEAEQSLRSGITLIYLSENLYDPSKKVAETYMQFPKVSNTAFQLNKDRDQSNGKQQTQNFNNFVIYYGLVLIALIFIFGIVLIIVLKYLSDEQLIESKYAALKKSFYSLESQFIAGKIDHESYEKKKREYYLKLSKLDAERKEKARHVIACDNLIMDIGILNEKLKNLKKHLNEGLISKHEFEMESKKMLSEISSLEAKLNVEISALKKGKASVFENKNSKKRDKIKDNYLPAKIDGKNV
jgi:uncharacterized protein